MPKIADNLQDQAVATPASAARKSTGLRVVLVALVLAGAMAAVYLSPIRAWVQNIPQLRHELVGLGVWVYPVSLVAIAVLVGGGLPRLIFCMAGGAILGFWWGLLIGHVGSLLGYYGQFLFVRWGGRDWAMHRWPKLQRWAELIEQQGLMGAILVRLLPIHGSAINVGLGLSHVKHRRFLVSTTIGMLPEAIPTTLVGAGLVKASLKDSVGYLLLAVLAFAAIWVACGYVLRAMRNSRDGEAILAEAES